MGYLVFDELDKTQSHVLLNQVANYFIKTKNGRTRSRLIIPEPFFVHSDLTTLIQLTDIMAYVVSWGLRLNNMTAPARPELEPLVSGVLAIRFFRETEAGNREWGFRHIRDLRPAQPPT